MVPANIGCVARYLSWAATTSRNAALRSDAGVDCHDAVPVWPAAITGAPRLSPSTRAWVVRCRARDIGPPAFGSPARPVASLQPTVRPSCTEGFEAHVHSANTRKLTIHKNVTASRMQAVEMQAEERNCGIVCGA